MNEIIPGAIRNILKDTTLTLEQKKEELARVNDLIKSLKASAPSKETLSVTHDIYNRLGYIPGALVQRHGNPDIGIILKYNTSRISLYDGKRYPLIIQFPGGTFEHSVLTIHYDDIEKFKDTPEKIFTEWKNDINIDLVKDLDETTAAKVITIQKLLNDMSEEQLVQFIASEAYTQETSTYIKDFASDQLDYVRSKTINKITHEKETKVDAMTLDELITYFESDECTKDQETYYMQEYADKKLRIKFKNMTGDTLMKYYDTKPYSKKIKALMREVIESK